MKFITIVLIAVSLAACNGSGTQQSAEPKIADTASQESATYYKRFSGTIAGQPVVLNLQVSRRAFDVLTATYYYVKQGKPIGLYLLPDSTVANGYTADEDPEHKGDVTQPHWKIVYSGTSITGKWTSADSRKTYDIDLKEDFPAGTFRLAVWNRQDSIPYKQDRSQPQAEISFELLRPGKDMNADDAAFMESTIQHALGCDTMYASSLEHCLQKQIDAYTLSYKQMLDEVDDTMLNEAFNNYYSGTATSVVYNDNGLLVLDVNVSDYSGGAHGNYWVSYLNMDMQQHRLWKLEDIMTVDSVKLRRILEEQTRRVFDIPAGSPISEHMLTDRVMPNGNCYITNTGVTFVYNPYEIAAYAYGIVSFFIPYTQIKELLKPDFKQRMKL